jgi:hypothetical protein
VSGIEGEASEYEYAESVQRKPKAKRTRKTKQETEESLANFSDSKELDL